MGIIQRIKYRVVQFRRRLRGVEVPSVPMLPESECAAWTRAVAASRSILEYGAGGSTLAACALGADVVTVESDRMFLDAVIAKAAALQGRLTPIYADIGPIGNYGIPLETAVTTDNLRAWREYVRLPWEHFKRVGREPDLIFVDGRFRVACVLESLLALSPESRCVILLDDFVGRANYEEVIPFSEGFELIGRLAQFRKPRLFDPRSCHDVLQKAYSDWR